MMRIFKYLWPFLLFGLSAAVYAATGISPPGNIAITVVPSGAACDYGPSTTMPSTSTAAGADLAAAGFMHCALNANFTDTSGALGGHNWVMSNPTTWLNQCNGTSTWGLFWLMWVNSNATTNGDGPGAACNRVSLIDDGTGTTVLNFQYAPSDAIDANHQGISLFWPLCGDSCLSLRPALPTALYEELTYKLIGTTQPPGSGIIHSLDSASQFDNDPNIPNPDGSGYLDVVILEGLANSHPGTSWAIDNYRTGICGIGKCSPGVYGADPYTVYHTIGHLVTTDGTSNAAACWYLDFAGFTSFSQEQPQPFDGTYCTHVPNFVGNELNVHDRRVMFSLGQPNTQPNTNILSAQIKSIRVFTCASYIGDGNHCPGPIVWH